MKIETLMESLPEHYPPVDRELIMRAYRYAEAAHANQKRASGEPYVTHCVAVASILSELNVPPAMVIAGLLHDTVEDTSVTLDDIRREFNDEVATLVDGVTKLTNLPRVSRGDQHAENGESDDLPPEPRMSDDARKRALATETLRKTFLAMGDDIRVVLIKLADRLHNMRTLGFMPDAKRRRIAQETLDIFAPLANRLGIWQIKWELEDLAFRYVEPEKYKEVAELLSERRADRELQIQNIIERIQNLLTQAGIQASVTGRPKHIYSIYRKMLEKGKSFELVRDLRGVRLIVPQKSDCYAALGVIHSAWRPIPQEFDDYVAAPKDNFYQSIHTAVIYEDGKPLEVQIRTAEMDQNAEYGIAAHWRYKERGRRDEAYEQRINWLRQMMDWRQEVTDAQEFVDGMKTDVFQDRVYVFTPRGDIIDLPVGSTPIDFAYHVHTEIGHRCRGAKVNSKLVTLDYTLKTGDQLEILTSRHGGPSRDWLNPNLGLVRTQRARTKIRQWFKKQDREQNITQGKIMLDREIRRLGLELNEEQILAAFDMHTLDDVFNGIGCGDISIGRIISRLCDFGKEELVDEQQLVPTVTHPPVGPKSSSSSVTVLGLKGMLTTFARCCKPVIGDEIVGYITRGRGVTIHRQDCPNILSKTDHERMIRVSWGEPQKTFPVPIIIRAYDRQGLVGDVSTILKEENINILDVVVKVTHHLASINLTLEVGDMPQLSRVLTRVENLANVIEATRKKPG